MDDVIDEEYSLLAEEVCWDNPRLICWKPDDHSTETSISNITVAFSRHKNTYLKINSGAPINMKPYCKHEKLKITTKFTEVGIHGNYIVDAR